MLSFLDILGKVVCTAGDMHRRLLVAGIGCLESIFLGHQMCFWKIVLIDVDNSAADVLYSLSITVCGSSDDA